MKIQRLAWAGIKIECGDAALFVDASVDPDYGANNIPLATSAGSRSAVVVPSGWITSARGPVCSMGSAAVIVAAFLCCGATRLVVPRHRVTPAGGATA